MYSKLGVPVLTRLGEPRNNSLGASGSSKRGGGNYRSHVSTTELQPGCRPELFVERPKTQDGGGAIKRWPNLPSQVVCSMKWGTVLKKFVKALQPQGHRPAMREIQSIERAPHRNGHFSLKRVFAFCRHLNSSFWFVPVMMCAGCDRACHCLLNRAFIPHAFQR